MPGYRSLERILDSSPEPPGLLRRFWTWLTTDGSYLNMNGFFDQLAAERASRRGAGAASLLLDDADAATARATLGLVVGGDKPLSGKRQMRRCAYCRSELSGPRCDCCGAPG